MGLLIAFNAAGRHQSFTLAARELGVAQAAISRQIRTLEDFLGLRLFVRGYRSVSLTDDGSRLHQAVSTNLEQLASTITELQYQTVPQSLQIGTTTAFSTYWLMPRLARFRKQYPDIELRLSVDDRNVDLKAMGIDLCIRYGEGVWRNLSSERLIGSAIEPICSPLYWGDRPKIDDPAELLNESLLDLDIPIDTSWKTWFSKHGVEMPKIGRLFVMDLYSNLIQGVLFGQGIALLGRPLVDDILSSGSIINPTTFGATALPGAYYLVSPVNHNVSPNQALFMDWLRSEADEDRQ